MISLAIAPATWQHRPPTTVPRRSSPRAATSPFAPDSLSLLFASPILRVALADALPAGTLDSLAEAVLTSWEEHLAEQHELPETDATRATTDGARLRARSDQELNEEFFYYQRSHYGVDGAWSEPRGWLASKAAQDVLEAVTASTAGYLERIAHHAGNPGSQEAWLSRVDPDRMHCWASVHRGGSTHPRHVHSSAVCSAVLYVRAPPNSGKICFFDPRGAVPPFEREVRHSPAEGELLIFPPWLSHAVATTSPSTEAGPRLSVSFNYVDEELEGGRHGWGEATAGLDVVTLESGLGLEPREEQGEEGE